MMLAAAKAVPIEAELARRGHRLKRAGRELVGACPVCGGTDRFAVHAGKRVWNCRRCATGGDILDLVQHIDGCSLGAAVRTLTGNRGDDFSRPTSPPPASNARPHVDGDGLETTERIWRETVDIKGTPGESYFARRGIPLADVPNFGGLRWYPKCPWERGTKPCVIGRFTDAITGEPRGIWRRAIDGSKPKSLGPMSGCVIRLWPDESVTTAIVVGEGVETTLSAATRFVHRGTLLQPAWAAASAGNLKHFPILAGIEAITVLADNDAGGCGQQAAYRCATRWMRAGREATVFTPRELGDYNDVVKRQP